MQNANVKPQNNAPQAIFLQNYRQPDYFIEEIYLTVEVFSAYTRVHSKLKICRQANQETKTPLVLNGEDLKLISVSLDDKLLSQDEYNIDEQFLTIHNPPAKFVLQTEVEIKPHLNLQLSGLYKSNNMYCTQCEAQGFRRITYYQDRPDNLAIFTTKIIADKQKYPVLLANGNCIERGDEKDGRHYVVWHDPFKKPSYLFALVAGDLQCIQDNFTTQSGKNVDLCFYVEPQNANKCQFAVDALKRSMRWDEQKYGREYDLDIYMVVAVNDFNMGAMENKGLNIFNAKYVLADEKSATDQDFENIESVIGHEYFHNWSGNRVTCRDWFQLSLKEGLTVYREQQFSADCGGASVKRIQDVKLIRSRQFSEDSGPLVHPVQPKSYIEINNFYTMTIYYKGAEVVRMLATILGEEKFRKGMDYYFDQYDGQAVTINEFVQSFEHVNQIDLSQFTLWYHQAGTPKVKIRQEFDSTKKICTLYFEQSCKDTPETQNKQPFMIPIKLGLYNNQGQALQFQHEKIKQIDGASYFILNDKSDSISINNCDTQPIPSFFGGFSAPVKCEYSYTPQELALLIRADKDGFNRWDAAQAFMSDLILADKPADTALIESFNHLLQDKTADPALVAQIITVPSFAYLSEYCDTVDIQKLLGSQKQIKAAITDACMDNLADCYQRCAHSDEGDFSGASIGYRSLKNVCLYYLAQGKHKDSIDWVNQQYHHGANMSDIMGALHAINQVDDKIRQSLLDDFYQKWQNEPLVVNKWLSLHALCELPDTLNQIKNLMNHPAFDITNPNKVYALLNGFAASNPVIYHDKNGEAYHFIAQNILTIDKNNPQVASRLCENLTAWRRYVNPNGQNMQKALQVLQNADKLSQDVYELVSKSLA